MKINTNAIMDHVNHLAIMSDAKYVRAHLVMINSMLKIVFRGIWRGQDVKLEELDLDVFLG